MKFAWLLLGVFASASVAAETSKFASLDGVFTDTTRSRVQIQSSHEENPKKESNGLTESLRSVAALWSVVTFLFWVLFCGYSGSALQPLELHSLAGAVERKHAPRMKATGMRGGRRRLSGVFSDRLRPEVATANVRFGHANDPADGMAIPQLERGLASNA